MVYLLPRRAVGYLVVLHVLLVLGSSSSASFSSREAPLTLHQSPKKFAAQRAAERRPPSSVASGESMPLPLHGRAHGWVQAERQPAGAPPALPSPLLSSWCVDVVKTKATKHTRQLGSRYGHQQSRLSSFTVSRLQSRV